MDSEHLPFLGTLPKGFLRGPHIIRPRITPTLVTPGEIAALGVGKTGRRFVLEHGTNKQRQKDVFMLSGLPGPGVYSSFTDVVANARCAILERVFYHNLGPPIGFQLPIIPDQWVVNVTLKPFWSKFARMIRTSTPVDVLVYPSTAYSGRRLKLYERAAANVAARGVSRKDAYLRTFLKHEKILISSKRDVPRVIQPRAPEYNVEVGRYIRHLEHPIYQKIATLFGGPTVMKGYNAFEVGTLFSQAWATYRAPAALGLDASRFDQHVSETMLKWEHMVYRKFYPTDRHFAEILEWQLTNRGAVRCADGTIKYTSRGGRCSGDMNTALGNCLIMSAMVYSFLQRYCCFNVRLFNNGDDCVLIGEESLIRYLRPLVPKFFSDLGFVMKVEPVVTCLEHVEFCQTHPVHDGTTWRMCRDPRKSLSKDATFLSRDLATTFLSNQLYAIGECGMSLCWGLPVLQAYYECMLRDGRAGGHVDPNFYESGFYRLSRGLTGRKRPVSDAARVSFASAFGIPPDLQLELERRYATLPKVGTLEVQEGAPDSSPL